MATEQIEFSTSPTSDSELRIPERRLSSSATFHDILHPQCITTADRSAKTYYSQSKFKTAFRRFTEPAPTSSAPKIDTSHTEIQKQSEKPSAIRRSTLQTVNSKSSKKDGSALLSRLFSRSSRKMEEGFVSATVYEYDSDEGVGAFEEHKLSL